VRKRKKQGEKESERAESRVKTGREWRTWGYKPVMCVVCMVVCLVMCLLVLVPARQTRPNSLPRQEGRVTTALGVGVGVTVVKQVVQVQ
jgi:hypothetical protein